MIKAADEYAERFGKKFDTLVWLTDSVLQDMHSGSNEAPMVQHAQVTVASHFEPDIADQIAEMGRVANAPTISLGDNRVFFDAVLNIYSRMRGGMRYLTAQHDTFVVAPEREGFYIAREINLLPSDRSVMPNAKRIPYEGGLIVGLALGRIPQSTSRCLIIDGAIASGSTLIALIEKLHCQVREFHVFSAHATASSVHALDRYAAHRGIDLYLNLGHVSGKLSTNRYALNPDGSVVIGDLGDLISPLMP